MVGLCNCSANDVRGSPHSVSVDLQLIMDTCARSVQVSVTEEGNCVSKSRLIKFWRYDLPDVSPHTALVGSRSRDLLRGVDLFQGTSSPGRMGNRQRLPNSSLGA